MPKRNRGPHLRFIDRRGVFYIIWYDLGAERMRSTGTADRAEAEQILLEFRGDGRLPDMGFVRDQEQLVYFIGGADGPIKIGVASDPRRRMHQMQCGSPVPLLLLAVCPGGANEEYRYHIKFRQHRLHREWFARHPDILAEIDQLNAQEMAA